VGFLCGEAKLEAEGRSDPERARAMEIVVVTEAEGWAADPDHRIDVQRERESIA
jgi:hypothetical protein